MLNKNYKLGSRWKLALLLPLTVLAIFIVSCTDKDASIEAIETAEEIASQAPEMEVFYVVEDMPKFNGGDPATEFRKYIAVNVMYPDEAKEAGVTGRIIISFIVDKEGKVLVPDQETLANIQGKPLDEVVVATYRKIGEETEAPAEKYIELLKEEVIRVVTSSPAWEPGKQRGKAVSVMYTFPINFVMQ